MLYPAELRRHLSDYFIEKQSHCQVGKQILNQDHLTEDYRKNTHDLLTTAYTVQSVWGGKHMENKDTVERDIDDLIFDEEDGGASQR